MSLSALPLVLAAVAAPVPERSAVAAPAPERTSAALSVDLELARPLVVAGEIPTRNVLRVTLRGRKPAPEAVERPALNLALVLDRSGSMAGDKLRRARQAARMVIERLGPSDMLSIVAYDDDVEVLVPATRVRNPAAIAAALDQLEADGQTALFAGVSRGIDEVRRFVDPARVDRVILLSDGRANVGPASPSELGRLGAAAAREGIAITTIGLGLGYNEDLMARLARESDGNHGFAESAEDLARFFDAELIDAMSVVAEGIDLRLDLASGVRIARAINRPLEIYPDHARGHLVQLGDAQAKHFLLELEIPAGTPDETRPVVTARVSARRVTDGRPDAVMARAEVRHVRRPELARRAENRGVLASAVEAIAVEQNRAALELRDQGKVEEAKKALRQNAAFLDAKAKEYESPELEAYSRENASTALELDDDDAWRRTRKRMRSTQHKRETQQSY